MIQDVALAPGRLLGGVLAPHSENAVTDMVGEYGSGDVCTQTDATAVGCGILPENLDEFLVRSPYVTITKSSAPLLLLQAESDLRCPPGQTDLVLAILKKHGAPVEMIRYPDEPHYMAGTGRPDRRVDRLERIVHLVHRTPGIAGTERRQPGGRTVGW